MKMVFSTKMKSSGQANNMVKPNIIVSQNVFNVNMLDKLKSSIECNDCKNSINLTNKIK
jgi:hypothetical protein